jgi:hypothetical protein
MKKFCFNIIIINNASDTFGREGYLGYKNENNSVAKIHNPYDFFKISS